MDVSAFSYRYRGLLDTSCVFLCLSTCLITLIAEQIYKKWNNDLSGNFAFGSLVASIVIICVFCAIIFIPAILTFCQGVKCSKMEIEELEYILGKNIQQQEENVEEQTKDADDDLDDDLDNDLDKGKAKLKILRRDSNGKWTYKPVKEETESQV